MYKKKIAIMAKIKLTEKQEKLVNFLSSGAKLVQYDDRLFMYNEIISSKILSSLMYKLHKGEYRNFIKKAVIVL